MKTCQKNVQIHKVFMHFRGLPERGFAEAKKRLRNI